MTARPNAPAAGPANTGTNTASMQPLSASSTTTAATPAQLAKSALRRLATERSEPTPDNYRRAYAAECEALGLPAPSEAAAPKASAEPLKEDTGPQWSELIGRITRGLDRTNKQWTTARKKESLQRVLEGSKHSAERLLQRLQQLNLSWDQDKVDAPVLEADAAADAAADPAADTSVHPSLATTTAPLAPSLPDPTAPDLPGSAMATATTASARPQRGLSAPEAKHLSDTLALALPDQEAPGQEARLALNAALASALAKTAAQQAHGDGIAEDMALACEQARRVIEQRHHLIDQLTGLCQTLTDSLVELAEDESWVSGQCVAMQAELANGLSPRGTRRMQDLLADTRERQKALRGEREAARQALKQMIHEMLSEIAELGQTTGRFQDKLVGYADTIGQADTLESLAGVVREMVTESRAVHGVIAQAQERMHTEHARASELSDRVRTLEDEIRKLSDEVSTDPLTQIANRRGLARAFDAERSRVERQGGLLAIGLLDVDNFKKLNDTLGHQTGDEALKFLSRRVSECLRPSDVIARYGGEEFVVLLPETEVDEAQQVLTRLQRQLSAEFFTADERKVFITFSAGVTQYRMDEPIEAGLDRADLALYEAKRTGKNRTCIG
jgi:diguanylate cyclase